MRSSQGALDGYTQNLFRPSQSIFNTKKSILIPKPLKVKMTPYNRSTPYIKSRMEVLLRNYEDGMNTGKYVKADIQQYQKSQSVGRAKL